MATYYFASTGLASNNGTSAATPKPLTYDVVRGITFTGGDQILLRSGDTFVNDGIYFDPSNVSPIPSAGNPIIVNVYGGTARATVYSTTAFAVFFYNTAGSNSTTLTSEEMGRASPQGSRCTPTRTA